VVEPVPSSAEDEPERDEPAEQDTESPEDETGSRRQAKQKKQRSFWKELPILIVIALVLAFVIQQFLARVYMIPSGSMETTLMVGDRILVDKVTYDFSEPEPGDVVVFKGPDPWVDEIPEQESSNGLASVIQTVGSWFGLAPPDERDFVKRVVATEGQVVQCCDDRNRVVVDGQPLDEPYIYWQPGRGGEQEEFGPVRVPENSVWVLGDNRNNSCDSRCQGDNLREGAVPVDNIIGKARIIVLPPSSWDGISDHNPQAAPQTSAMGGDWLRGVPLGAGALAAWPTLWAGRRVGRLVREAAKRGA
jgi:signal peptidase I